MATSSLSFAFNPFKLDAQYQAPQAMPVTQIANPVNLLDQNPGNSTGAQTASAANLAYDTASALDLGNLAMSDPHDETSSYLGTQINLYA